MNHALIAGVDEVGRGAWAGPMVAAAVILNDQIAGLADSKTLSASKRQELGDIIFTQALAWAIAEISAQEIDSVGMAEANRLVMRRAIIMLKIQPVLVRIDGFSCGIDLPEEVIIKGDVTMPEISAASIIAKVYRDNLMLRLHHTDSRYAFDQHVGYGTALHKERLMMHGPSQNHRSSFSPIKNLV